MKLLLDENLPHPLRRVLAGHDCFTAAYVGYAGLSNGRLLARAAVDGFDALITQDANLEYQQDTATLPLSVVVLHAKSNDLEVLLLLVPALLDALATLAPKTIAHVP